MSIEKDAIIRRAVFGEQVQQFFNSPLGQYLQHRMQAEWQEAVAEFAKCDPSDAEKVRQIQAKMRYAEHFEQWLGEAVQAGLQAIGVLEDREE